MKKTLDLVRVAATKKAENCHHLGVLAAQRQDFELAIQYFNQALTLQPEAPYFHNHLANALVQLRQFEMAVCHFKMALQLQPNYTVAHNNLARVYYKQGQLMMAAQHFSEALKLQPDYLEARFNLGLVYVAKNELNAARQQFQQILVQHPSHLLTHVQLAQIAFRLRDWDCAESHYQIILQKQANQVDALNNLGAIFSYRQRYKEAAQCFEKVLAVMPDHLQAKSNLAAVLLQRRQLSAACQHYADYLRRVPDNAEAHYNLGVALMLRGRLSEAIGAFQRLLQLTPKSVDAWCNLAAIYLRQANPHKACEAYQTVLAIQANHPIAQYMLCALTQQGTPFAAPPAYIKQLFDHYAPHFDQHLIQGLQYQIPQQLYQLVSPYLPNKNLTALDLGCGTGLSGLSFREARIQYFAGVDLSPSMLIEAKKKGIYHQLIEAELLTFLSQVSTADRQQYDLILSVDTLVYFGDLSPVFQQIARCLGSAAHFAFSIELGDDCFYRLRPTGRYQHTRAGVETWAAQCGLQIIAAQVVQGRCQAEESVKIGLFLLKKQKK
jgi:predicted TPR repeat methyltransferase